MHNSCRSLKCSLLTHGMSPHVHHKQIIITVHHYNVMKQWKQWTSLPYESAGWEAVWLCWHGICFWTHLSLLLLFWTLGRRQPCDSSKLCVLCFGALPWVLQGFCLNCSAQCQNVRRRKTQQRLERRTHFPLSAVNFNDILRTESSIFYLPSHHALF